MISPTLSADDLIAIARAHHPANVFDWDPHFRETPEYRRRSEACARSIDDGRWRSLLTALRTRFPDSTVEDRTVPYQDLCRTCRLFLPNADLHAADPISVVGLVSFVAPIYVTYASLMQNRGGNLSTIRTTFEPTGETARYASAVADAVESIYGYWELPRDVAGLILPDLAVGNLLPGQVTLLDALLSDNRW